MKTSKQAWEQEYTQRRLMTGSKPAKSFLNWIKQVIKQRNLRGQDLPLLGLRVLDLGSGEGKNALHLAKLGATVCGIEIATNAVTTTNLRVAEAGLGADSSAGSVQVTCGSIGNPFNFPAVSFDLIIDITSSNSLSEVERANYLQESARVLKPDGQMFIRTLCKDGDSNAKKLLRLHPGAEVDTYLQPEWGLVERVFNETDIRTLYGAYFTITSLTKETHYTTVGDRKFKRNFWLLDVQKAK